MELIFAENFKNDFGKSIERRYPGSFRESIGLVDEPDKFPLYQYNTLITKAKPFDPTKDTRLEIVLGLAGTATVADNNTDSMHIFGIHFTTSSAGVSIQGILVEGRQHLKDVSKLHIVLEYDQGTYILMAFADGEAIITPSVVEYTPRTDITGYVDRAFSKIKPFLDYIVAVHNTEYNTLLKTPVFEDRGIVFNDTGLWEYTDGGFVEDTDKSNPSEEEPNIYTEELSSMTIEIKEGSKVYMSVQGTQEDRKEAISIGGIILPTYKNSNALPVSKPEGILEVGRVNVSQGICNNDGICFLGELTGTEFATFAELNTLLGVTQGTVNKIAGSDTFLHLIVDGQEVVVPKVSIKYNVNYNSIYAAGLVFGTDDYGLYVPEGIAPTNQRKVVTIKGQQYLVRLMKGCNGSEGPNVASESDLPWTQRSEFSRIFYPLSNDSRITSYKDVKLASYTPVELGLEGVSGSYVWVQERALNVNTNRFVRGYNGPAYVGHTASSSAFTNHGFAPRFF